MKAAPHMSTNGDEVKAAPHIRLNGGAGASSLEDDEQFEARKHEWQVRYAYWCPPRLSLVPRLSA